HVREDGFRVAHQTESVYTGLARGRCWCTLGLGSIERPLFVFAGRRSREQPEALRDPLLGLWRFKGPARHELLRGARFGDSLSGGLDLRRVGVRSRVADAK